MRPPNAEMKCSECAEEVEPMRGSSWVLAWYLCPSCDHFWSAPIKDGKPIAALAARVQESVENVVSRLGVVDPRVYRRWMGRLPA